MPKQQQGYEAFIERLKAEWQAADPILPKPAGRKGQGKKGGNRPPKIDIWGMQELPEDDD